MSRYSQNLFVVRKGGGNQCANIGQVLLSPKGGEQSMWLYNYCLLKIRKVGSNECGYMPFAVCHGVHHSSLLPSL